MTAIIDGITVMGKPKEINSLIEMRGKKYKNWDVTVRDIIDNAHTDNRPPLNSTIRSSEVT